GKKRLAATCRRRAAAVKRAVNRHGWDGAWYRRCYDDHGNPIGSKRNRDAKIHIMTQMWGALTGVGAGNRDAKAMDAVEKHLKNDFGYEIFTPPYRTKDVNIGQFSALTGFMNNNNYVHHNAMKMGADLKLGRGDLAWETFRKMLPSNPKNRPTGPQVEPYAYANCIVSSRHDRPGESEIGWVTGSTSWWFTVATEWMMGAIPDYEGLRIDPCLPGKWTRVRLRRPFRGAVYDVTVRNPGGVNRGVKSITVDGKKLKGSLIRPHGDGKTHKVEVVMG
ncbi:MAG TPA: glycosyl hydrolase family 65 protein, partial [Planctomycetota bacterium]|nr:glycosyl hydrolase family 65 protein [Planctomycetota bacterium]